MNLINLVSSSDEDDLLEIASPVQNNSSSLQTDWMCTRCTYENPVEHLQCTICSSQKPNNVPLPLPSDSQHKQQQQQQPHQQQIRSTKQQNNSNNSHNSNQSDQRNFKI